MGRGRGAIAERARRGAVATARCAGETAGWPRERGATETVAKRKVDRGRGARVTGRTKATVAHHPGLGVQGGGVDLRAWGRSL